MTTFSLSKDFDGVPCAPVEVVESWPSRAARLVFDAVHATVYPVLTVGARALGLPWPFGLLD
ncbi:MAG TPA: hypothetical protein VF299_09745, partial [Mycobacterium sp.]